MASYDPLNFSTFNFKDLICYSKGFDESEATVSPSSSSSLTFEFESIFSSLPFEWSAPDSPSGDETKPTQGIPVSTPFIDFRVPTSWRQYRVVAIDQDNFGVFFVNLDDIARVSTGLLHCLTAASQSNGRFFAAGEIPVGAEEFELLLLLISNSYQGTERSNALVKYMKRMLILSSRFGIPSLVEECNDIVLVTDISTLDISIVKSWYEAFKKTQIDEVYGQTGVAVSKTIRSYIISEMIRSNRFHELSTLVPTNFLNILVHRIQAGVFSFSSHEVDSILCEIEMPQTFPPFSLPYSQFQGFY